MSQTHQNCPKCHSEVAIDLQTCPRPKCGAEMPKGDAHQLAALEARRDALRKSVADRKAATEREIAELEAQAGAALADGLARSA